MHDSPKLRLLSDQPIPPLAGASGEENETDWTGIVLRAAGKPAGKLG